MILEIERGEDLVEVGGTMYAIAVADIIPDFILIPSRNAIFGETSRLDEMIPDSYETLGYDSRNFIACTGSIPIFLLI